MSNEDREHLNSEKLFLQRQLEKLPPQAHLTRMSAESRLRRIENELESLPSQLARVRAKLTFDGAPVIGSRGIFADFGARAINAFAETAASIAASFAAPLAPVGPIPNRDQSQLLITSTAIGSFGFILEEAPTEQLTLLENSPVSLAIQRTQELIQSTLGDDEELAEVVSETDPRALEKLRTFLKLLSDSNAVCSLQFQNHSVRFSDVGEVRRSLDRLAAENLHEQTEFLSGAFLGVLPLARTFEFRTSKTEQIIRGKVSRSVGDIDEINNHLGRPAVITVLTTQVGKGRPRYFLVDLPKWEKP